MFSFDNLIDDVVQVEDTSTPFNTMGQVLETITDAVTLDNGVMSINLTPRMKDLRKALPTFVVDLSATEIKTLTSGGLRYPYAVKENRPNIKQLVMSLVSAKFFLLNPLQLSLIGGVYGYKVTSDKTLYVNKSMMLTFLDKLLFEGKVDMTAFNDESVPNDVPYVGQVEWYNPDSDLSVLALTDILGNSPTNTLKKLVSRVVNVNNQRGYGLTFMGYVLGYNHLDTIVTLIKDVTTVTTKRSFKERSGRETVDYKNHIFTFSIVSHGDNFSLKIHSGNMKANEVELAHKNFVGEHDSVTNSKLVFANVRHEYVYKGKNILEFRELTAKEFATLV